MKAIRASVLAVLLLVLLPHAASASDSRVRLCHWEPSTATLEMRLVQPDQVTKRLREGDSLPTHDTCGPTATDPVYGGPVLVCHLRRAHEYVGILVMTHDLGWWLLDNDQDYVARGGSC